MIAPSTALAASGDISKGLTSAVGASLADIYGVVLGDRIANWRLQNVARSHAKVRQVVEAEGLALCADNVPERFAYSWFEEASKQDDDTIQDMFAKLLARTAGNASARADERLTRMLSRLTHNDAVVFSRLYGSIKGKQVDLLEVPRLLVEQDACSAVGNDGKKCVESLINEGFLSVAYLSDNSVVGNLESENISLDHIGKQIAEAIRQEEYLYSTRLGVALARMVL